MKHILLALLLGTTAYGGDCVPLTFATLSTLLNHPVTKEDWTREIRKNPDDQHAVNFSAWKAKFPLLPLVCVYSKEDIITRDVDVNRIIDRTGTTPYVWVGSIPDEMIADHNSGEDAHAAITFICQDFAYIVHTVGHLNPQQFYVEKLEWNDFIKRTWLVYEITPVIKGMNIQWAQLPDSIFK